MAGYCEKQAHREREILIMPKSQYVDPNRAFDSGFIKFNDIPVCQYNLTIEDEKKIYSKQDLINIYRDMAIIREFETMLNEIKTKSVYNGVEYNNPGQIGRAHV